MPKEDRRIIFDYGETYKAIYALCTKKEQRRPPPGAIAALEIDPEDNTKIHIKIENHHEGTQHNLEYSRDFLAAALLLYCRSLNIPIAKMARKSVEAREDKVFLRLIM